MLGSVVLLERILPHYRTSFFNNYRAVEYSAVQYSIVRSTQVNKNQLGRIIDHHSDKNASILIETNLRLLVL